MKAEDITGQQFGRLTVVERAGRNKQGNALWKCTCVCGGEATVRGADLRNGHALSCGCYCRERTSQANYKHGHSGKQEDRSPEYKTWVSMRNRVLNESHEHYKYYGGRGITICPEWESFETFLRDMGPKPSPEYTLDRKNSDLNYEPSNCRWATQAQQNQENRHANGYYNIKHLAEQD